MAYLFNGATHRISRSSAPLQTWPLTLFGRIRLTASDSLEHLMLHINEGTNDRGFYLRVTQATGQQRARIASRDGSSNQSATTTTSLTVGQWHTVVGHVTAANNREIWLDNSGNANNLNSVSPGTLTKTVIGAYDNNGTLSSNVAHQLADIGALSGITTSDERAAFAKGVSPALIWGSRSLLKLHHELLDGTVDRRGDAFTVTGATKADHPRVYMPAAYRILGPAPVGGSGVTGTLAATEEADTASIAGDVLVQGTLGPTEGADTVAISGNVPVAGSLAATEGGDSTSLSGAVIVQGVVAVSEAGDTAALVGTIAVQGLLAASESVDSVSLDAAVLVQGSLAVSETGADSASLTGLVPVQGTLAATEGIDTFLASGSNTAVGFLATSEAADTASLSGSVLVRGSLAATESADSAAFAGSAPVHGAVALTELPDAASFAGQVIVQGILSATELADIMLLDSAPVVPPAAVPDRRTTYASRISQTAASDIGTTYASPRTGTSE